MKTKKYLLFVLLSLFLMLIIYFFVFYNKNEKNSIVVLNVHGYQDNIDYKNGTGFVYKISDYAYILTNYHVVSDCDDLYVFYDGKRLKARLLNYDDYEDLAILIVDKKYINNYMKFGNSNNIKGSFIRVITSDNNITKEIDGVVFRDVEPVKISYNNNGKMLDLIKIKSNIKFGYSGSPIVDKDNYVIGMVTMIDKDNLDYAYALPSYQLVNKIKILENGSIYRPILGVNVSSSLDINGVIINELYDGYPFSNALLEVGDIIVAIDDIQINDVLEFRYYLYKYEKNDVVKIKYYRSGEYYEVYVLLDK